MTKRSDHFQLTDQCCTSDLSPVYMLGLTHNSDFIVNFQFPWKKVLTFFLDVEGCALPTVHIVFTWAKNHVNGADICIN